MKSLKFNSVISLVVLLLFLSTNKVINKDKLIIEDYFDYEIGYYYFENIYNHLFIGGLIIYNKSNMDLYIGTPSCLNKNNSVFIDTTNKIIFIDLQRFGNHSMFEMINPNIFVPVYQKSKMRLNLQFNIYLKDSINLYVPGIDIGLSQNFEKILVMGQDLMEYSVIVKATLSSYDSHRIPPYNDEDSTNKPFFTTMITKPMKLRK